MSRNRFAALWGAAALAVALSLTPKPAARRAS